MRRLLYILLSTASFNVSVREAFTQPQVYTIDPDRSEITLSGNAVGFTLQQQGSGSLTTKFKGSIQAVVAGDTIEFSGGSLIQGIDNGSWEPKSDGSAGSEPANFGGQATSIFASAKAAIRKIELDLISGQLPLNNGQFDSRGLTFFFPSNAPSTFAYLATGFINENGFEPLQGYATNNIATMSSITSSASEETLTIPVDATFVASLLGDNDTTIIIKGQLLAKRTAAAVLRVGSIGVVNQTVTLQWQAEPNQNFQILSSPNLQSWQTNATSVSSTTGSYEWTGPATETNQFFRLEQQ